jgi:aspartyl-tRNA(Asn)/glutamyl-tRNA(Gln) amidotransferase subunit A
VRDLVDPGRQEMVELGFAMNGGDVGAVLDQRAQWNAAMNALMADYDLLLTPTMPTTAFQAGLHHPPSSGGRDLSRFRWSPFTYGMNLTGQPAASVPCGFASDGLPVGVQVVGRRHDDAVVLRASAVLEELRPWQAKRPPFPGA